MRAADIRRAGAMRPADRAAAGRRRRSTTPADFNRLFPATGGALYGRSSHGWTASFQRPGARTRIPGLYLAGGSTHPGPGVPMAALSGRSAAASLLADLASISQSPPNGYAWWYVDALSDDGEHGITIIAFIGSVFSPYYAFARRKGPADPLNHCAINVAVYRKGGNRWAMTKRPRGAVRAHVRHVCTSVRSHLSWDGKALTIHHRRDHGADSRGASAAPCASCPPPSRRASIHAQRERQSSLVADRTLRAGPRRARRIHTCAGRATAIST